PRGRSVDSNPKRRAMRRAHVSPPKGVPPGDAPLQCRLFGRTLSGVDQCDPVSRSLRRGIRQPIWPTAAGPKEAGPAPVVAPPDQVGPQRVAFDITQYRPEVFVRLDRERLESPLPDVAGATIASVVAADVGGEEPLHPPAEVAVVFWPEYQVKMIGHEGIAEN